MTFIATVLLQMLQNEIRQPVQSGSDSLRECRQKAKVYENGDTSEPVKEPTTIYKLLRIAAEGERHGSSRSHAVDITRGRELSSPNLGLVK